MGSYVQRVVRYRKLGLKNLRSKGSSTRLKFECRAMAFALRKSGGVASMMAWNSRNKANEQTSVVGGCGGGAFLTGGTAAPDDGGGLNCGYDGGGGPVGALVALLVEADG